MSDDEERLYTVTLVLSLEAPDARSAAQLFHEWMMSRDYVVLVDDEDSGESVDVDLSDL